MDGMAGKAIRPIQRSHLRSMYWRDRRFGKALITHPRGGIAKWEILLLVERKNKDEWGT